MASVAETSYDLPEKSAEGVPASFGGQTIRHNHVQVTDPQDFDGLVSVLRERFVDDAVTLGTVFNRAYDLEIQKRLKKAATKEGATVESLQAFALSPEAERLTELRPRGEGTGTPKPSGVTKKLKAEVKANEAVFTDILEDPSVSDEIKTKIRARMEALQALGVDAAPAKESATEAAQTGALGEDAAKAAAPRRPTAKAGR